MITIKTQEYVTPGLPYQENIKHIGTIYSVVDSDGTQTVLDTVLNTDIDFRELELTQKQFIDVDILPNVTYTAKARYILEPGGLQGWSDEVLVEVDNGEHMIIHTLPPQELRAPVISLDFPIDATPTSLITFTLDHTASVHSELDNISYLVESLTGEIFEASLNDRDSLSTVKLHNVLDVDTVYGFKVMVTGINNSSSILHTKWFKTAPISDDGLAFDSNSIGYGTSELINLDILGADLTTTVTVHNGDELEITDNYVNVSSLDAFVPHILILQSDTKGPVYYITVPDSSDTLPQPLPYTTR